MEPGPGALETDAYVSDRSLERNLWRRAAPTRVDGDQVHGLIDRARDRDPEAFEELYRLYHADVFRLARFHVGGPAAGEVVTETFLRAWSAVRRYDYSRGPFEVWLIGITRRVVAAFDERSSDRSAVARAVADLLAAQRSVIELKFLLGWTNEQIAETLEKGAGAVNTLQWRALESLRRRLEGRTRRRFPMSRRFLMDASRWEAGELSAEHFRALYPRRDVDGLTRLLLDLSAASSGPLPDADAGWELLLERLDGPKPKAFRRIRRLFGGS